MEDDPGHPQAGGGRRILRNIVNINSFLRPDRASLESLAVDDRVRFACADSVRIDADWKEAEKGETGFLMGHVDRIGIRKQCEPVVLGKTLQENFGMDGDGVQGAIPDFAELLESKRSTETLGEM